MKLKFLCLRKFGVNQDWWLCAHHRVLHVKEKCSKEEQVYGSDADMEGLSCLGEKAPVANFVTTTCAFLVNYLHFFLMPVLSSLRSIGFYLLKLCQKPKPETVDVPVLVEH